MKLSSVMAAFQVDSVAALRNVTKINNKVAYTAGYYAAGDGGNGEYWLDESDTTSVDNGFTVIVAVDGGRWKLQRTNGAYNLKQGGVKGDGVTDNRANIVNILSALSSGGVLETGSASDIYKVVATTSPVFTIPANLRIEGSAIFNISSFSTSFFNVINLSAGSCYLKDISINWAAPAGSSGVVMFLFGNGNDITLDGINVDAGVTDIGGGLISAPNHLFSIGGNASNVKIINDCFFTKFKFGVLKTNASAAINSKWKFLDSSFETFYSPALTFNTPGGDWDDVEVSGCTLKDSLGNYFGFYPHMGGVAGNVGSGKYVFRNNKLLGLGRGWHFEEGAEQVIIDGDIFAVNENAIDVVDNNVSGSYLTPSKFLITNCLITKTGTPVYDVASVRGINFSFDGSGTSSIKDSIVANNVITGYDIGIQTPEYSETTVISDNNIINCAKGLRGWRVGNNIHGNTFNNCSIGIESQSRGGLSGDNTFISCVEPFSDLGFNSGATKFSIITNDYSFATGVNAINLLTLGARVYGFLTLSLWSVDGASSRFATFEVTWDGTTLTATSKTAGGSGNILAPSLINNAGKLAISANNSTGSTRLVSVETVFSGGWHLS